jgi:hypothetical protein
MPITVGEVQQYLADRAQGKAGKLSDAIFNRAIPHGIRMLSEHYIWSFFRKTTQLVLKAKYSTGTISVSNLSTAVTGSGTTFPADAGGQVLVPDIDSRGYLISTRDSDTGLTLTDAYVNSDGDDLSGGTYDLLYRDASLPADFRDVEEVYIKGDGCFDRLDQVRVDEVDESWALRAGAGTPRFFAIERSVASGTSSFTLRLYPAPETIQVLSMVYHRRPVEPDLDDEDAVFDWPDVYRDALFAACLKAASEDAFSDLRGLAASDYRRIVERARLDDQRHAGPIVLGGNRKRAHPHRFKRTYTIDRGS